MLKWKMYNKTRKRNLIPFLLNDKSFIYLIIDRTLVSFISNFYQEVSTLRLVKRFVDCVDPLREKVGIIS